jgi:hypothetical protein
VTKKYQNSSFDTVNCTLLNFAKIGFIDVDGIFGGPKRFDPIVTNHHQSLNPRERRKNE